MISELKKLIKKKNYKLLLDDCIKFTVILLVVNFLMFASNFKTKLLSSNYLKLIININLGLVTYWLIIKEI